MLTKLNLGERKGPKSRGSARVVSCTALYHTYNREPKKMGVYAVEFDAPADATCERLIELAHRAGATVGDHSLAGVFEIQTPTGTWTAPKAKAGKLLTRSNSGVSPHAVFVPARLAAKGAR